MKQKIIFYFLFGAMILILLSACSRGPGKYDDFAKCLFDKGVTMYGTEWCSHCQNQKREFGSSFQYIDYVDCDLQARECRKTGVNGYPTWKINGESYPGEQRFDRLASLSGCEL